MLVVLVVVLYPALSTYTSSHLVHLVMACISRFAFLVFNRCDSQRCRGQVVEGIGFDNVVWCGTMPRR